MIIADTSIWIEFFKANEPVFSLLGSLLEEHEIIGIECVFGELLQGTRNQRELSTILEYWEALLKRDERGIMIEAGKLSAKEKFFSKGIGLIDAALIVASRKFNARIWSSDKKLLSALSHHEIFDTSRE